ncbi:MAG: ComEA family DNA-binding protein [Flavobacteriaceae bacterium]
MWDRQDQRHWEEVMQQYANIADILEATPYRYNPNYLTDYRIYQWGLSPEIFDRLQTFRKTGKTIRNLNQFQEITGLEDSIVQRLKHQLNFPAPRKTFRAKPVEKKLVKKAINTATDEDLQKVKGIGAVRAARNIKYKNYLEGFSSLDQLDEVYGLPAEVVDALKKQFEVLIPAKIHRRAFAQITLDSLSKLPYLSWKKARQLIGLRSQYPQLPLDSLWRYSRLSAGEIQRIKLYLY